MNESVLASLRSHKVYCEITKCSIFTPSPLMQVMGKDISAYWVLNVLAIPPMGEKVVEIAEGPDQGRVFVAEILTLRRLIQPYIIILLQELQVPTGT